MKCPACEHHQTKYVKGQGHDYYCSNCDYWFRVHDPATEHAKEYDKWLGEPPDEEEN